MTLLADDCRCDGKHCTEREFCALHMDVERKNARTPYMDLSDRRVIGSPCPDRIPFPYADNIT